MSRTKAKIIRFPELNKSMDVGQERDYVDEELEEFGIRAFFTGKAPTRNLFITEGRYNSEQISCLLGSISISLHSRNNYEGIRHEIRIVSDRIYRLHDEFKGFKSVSIAIDNDILSSYQTYLRIKEMTDQIKQSYPEMEIYYLQWSELASIGEILDREGKDIKNTVRVIRKDFADSAIEKGMSVLTDKYRIENPAYLHPVLFRQIQI